MTKQDNPMTKHALGVPDELMDRMYLDSTPFPEKLATLMGIDPGVKVDQETQEPVSIVVHTGDNHMLERIRTALRVAEITDIVVISAPSATEQASALDDWLESTGYQVPSAPFTTMSYTVDVSKFVLSPTRRNVLYGKKERNTKVKPHERLLKQKKFRR